MNEAVCIIPARGGSKRIPRKNQKHFRGRPIIAYSIEAALDSRLFSEIMVSTDDHEIASIARQYGASVPFMRSAANSDDYANTNDVISEVLGSYVAQGRSFRTVCCLYPAAPFVTAEMLREAMRALSTNASANSVIPVLQYSHPPQRAMHISDGQLVFKHPEYSHVRSQDLEPLYYDSGQFYMCYAEAFASTGRLAAPPTLPYVVSELLAQDIDTLEDWALAEIKYEAGEGKSNHDQA